MPSRMTWVPTDLWRSVAVWTGTERVIAEARPASRLGEVMQRAGGPLRSADIGVDAAFYAGAVQHARYLRDRFTFLDLAGDAGVLQDHFVA